MMNGHGYTGREYLPALMLWGLVYLALGYVSLLLDDPQSRVAMVWFAAGASISACLSLPRRYWPLLFIVLLFSRSALDALMRHSLETSIVLSLISIGGDFAVAWCVHHFSRGRDDFRKVGVWLISTFIVSVLAALAGTGWLELRHPLPYFDTAALWWAANVSGTIVATTILTGLSWEPARTAPGQVIATFSGVVLIIISATFVFSLPPASEERAGLVYGLACIPILLTAMLPLLAGSFAGALGLLALSITVVVFSWMQAGPFFIRGLFRGEPLLIAQCYLSGTAVLMIFIRLQQQLFFARRARAPEIHILSFLMNAQTGKLEWDFPDWQTPPEITRQISDRDSLLAGVSPRVRRQLWQRWDAILSGKSVSSPLLFRLRLSDGTRPAISERHLIRMHTAQGEAIAGEWGLIKGPLPLSREEEY